MTDADITAATETDIDNPPLADMELSKLRTGPVVQEACRHSGLGEAAFARTFHINLARLKDLEQGRTRTDSAPLAYLTEIDKDPASVRRALEG